MLHFNFNQLGSCLYNSGKTDYVIRFPLDAHVPIGELVTIGRKKDITAVFIPCDAHSDNAAMTYADMFKSAENMNIPADCDKVIQYVPAIKGYLLAYFFNL